MGIDINRNGEDRNSSEIREELNHDSTSDVAEEDSVQSGKKMMNVSAKVFGACLLVTSFFMYKATLVAGTVSAYEPFPTPDYISGSNPIIFMVIAMTIAGYIFFRGFGRMMGWHVPKFLRSTVTAIGVIIMFCLLGVISTTPATNAEKELLELQHSWAEERYGIVYDSVESSRVDNIDRKAPDLQKYFYSQSSKGRVAEVCPDSGGKILLCYPGTADELPVIIK